MSIIDSKSVLILGAGTSAPFGLSLGGDLIEVLATNLENETEKDNFLRWQHLIDTQPLTAFSFSPIRTTLTGSENDTREFDQKAKELTSRLRASTHETIDDFLVDNSDFSTLIKTAISSALFSQIYNPRKENRYVRFSRLGDIGIVEDYQIKNFLGRHLTREDYHNRATGPRNWVHLLINMVRYAVRNGFFEHKIKIITFNYDTILEHILEHLFQQTQFQYDHYTNYFDIVHPHGSFGSLELDVKNPIVTVSAWAKAICVVQEHFESLPNDIKTARESAKNWVSQSTRVYATGFAFAGANCRLLGLYESGGPNELYYNNYDGNMGLKQAVNRFSAPIRHPSARVHRYEVVECPDASKEHPVSVEDWFAAGYAGEPPA